MKNWMVGAGCAALLVSSGLVACSALDQASRVVTGREIVRGDVQELAGAEVDVLAYASAGAWAAVQREATRVVGLDVTPDDMRTAILRVDAVGSPLVLDMTGLAERYAALRDAGLGREPEALAVREEIVVIVPRVAEETRNLAAALIAVPVEKDGVEGRN